MLTCRVDENGNLRVTCDRSEDQEELVEVFAARGEMAALCEGLEGYSCNGSFAPFDAGDGNPFVGLTSAPCIAESLDWDGDGQAEIVGRFWYHSNYMTESAVQELCAGNTVVFTLGGEM
jgi:hypothetical protein